MDIVIDNDNDTRQHDILVRVTTIDSRVSRVAQLVSPVARVQRKLWTVRVEATGERQQQAHSTRACGLQKTPAENFSAGAFERAAAAWWTDRILQNSA